ncbi:restriction endonuclease [Rathayibacter sp. AY1A2]|uniref:BREX-1 system adenine-specific DNA-methyltransferase PglX n=1 Tax=Rathayibacter sp. AY1A2 TaxID=2080520 RepID=UPI000CE84D51|nr:BREX-1 system adenine-specific DNA-methyltransferase PglX [Rathayibacter sp. AY1A2]PPF39322.1 restriction endonuclease [Rathayibacter sp. AY1A2]
MDTKPLERFASWARRELINAVDAQTTAVLAVGSIARSERAEIVKKLEAEIGRHGRQNIVDKVAYIWFNRIVALRFMDARGYTDAGVVSPAQGQAHGQPEILSDAKRGNLDTDVVTNSRTANAIIGLLDGTRRSTDVEGEAYALLLTEYCRHWHMSMPFMFEREGDYTELLVPANLLADGAILSRAREVLTEDVCDDVEVIGWLYQFYISERKDQVLAGFKKDQKAGAEEIAAATQLFTPHWIVRYLVENSLGRLWMLNRPGSRLIDLMEYYVPPVDEPSDFAKIERPEELSIIDPASGSGHMLTYAFDLLYAIYEEEGHSPSSIPGLILTHNLHGTEIDPRAGSLAAFALTMKARAKQRTFFNRQIRPNICVIEPVVFEQEELDFLVSGAGDTHEEETFWNQFAEADLFGSLIQPDPTVTYRLARHHETLDRDDDLLKSDIIETAGQVVRQAEFLARKYSVVIANPPYLGTKNMGGRLAEWLSKEFPDVKQDLYGCFIRRATNLVTSGGMVAEVVGDTWLTISTFGGLRKFIVESCRLHTLLHIHDVSNHSDVFGANTALVISPGRTDSASDFQYVDALSEDAKISQFREAVREEGSSRRFVVDARDFSRISGMPFAYRLPEEIRHVFMGGKVLADVADVRKGISTGDVGLFLRFWFEVSRSASALPSGDKSLTSDATRRWVAYNKGGEFRRWFGNQLHVVDWADGGRQLISSPKAVIRNLSYQGRESLGWTAVSSGRPSFRFFPQGFHFDGAGPSIFPNVGQSPYELLGILNSTVSQRVLAVVAPTLNFEVGIVAGLPVPGNALDSTVDGLVRQLVEEAKSEWDESELSWGFRQSPLLRWPTESLRHAVEGFFRASQTRAGQMALLSQKVDMEVNSAFGVSHTLTSDVRDGESPADLQTTVIEFVAYAVGCMFGRFSIDEPGLILADQGATLQDYLARVPAPSFMPDADNVIPFVDDGWFEDDIVERFRQFLRAAFGEDHFEENLRFVEESLGVKALRDYFITKAGKSKFYYDHVQRYKKRPIYWMFSSPKGSFNALIYMHRYTPSTVSTVLNEYLREYRAKLEVALAHAEQAAAGGGSAKEQKEADRLRKVLVELAEYEHDVLYPLATKQIVIDLDDGVKANYPKFYPALKNISGLEATE